MIYALSAIRLLNPCKEMDIMVLSFSFRRTDGIKTSLNAFPNFVSTTATSLLKFKTLGFVSCRACVARCVCVAEPRGGESAGILGGHLISELETLVLSRYDIRCWKIKMSILEI